jgi:hypothetical protein
MWRVSPRRPRSSSECSSRAHTRYRMSLVAADSRPTVPHERSATLAPTTLRSKVPLHLPCHGPRFIRLVMAQSQAQVQRQQVPRLANLLKHDDDWTGLSDAAERRKRQNRLNVRAHRTFSSRTNTRKPFLKAYRQAQASISPSRIHYT